MYLYLLLQIKGSTKFIINFLLISASSKHLAFKLAAVTMYYGARSIKKAVLSIPFQ